MSRYKPIIITLVVIWLQLINANSADVSSVSSLSSTINYYDYNVTSLYTGLWSPVGEALSWLPSAFSKSTAGGKLFLMIDTRALNNQTYTGVRATLRIYNVDEDTSLDNALVRWLLYGTYTPATGFLRLSTNYLSLYPDMSLGFNYTNDAAEYAAAGKTFRDCLSCTLSLNALPRSTTETQTATQAIRFVSEHANNDVPLFTNVPTTTITNGIDASSAASSSISSENTHWLVSMASAMSPVNHVATAFPQLSVALMMPSASSVASSNSVDEVTWMDLVEEDEATRTVKADVMAINGGNSNTNSNGNNNGMTIQALTEFGGSFESRDPHNISIVNYKLMLTQISAVEYLDPERVMNYVIMVATVSFGQYMLIKRQLKYSESQARMMKVSLWSIFMFALIDFLFFTMHYSIAFIRTELFTYFLVLAIGGFAVFFQELKFMLSMWKVRHPESFNQGAEHTHREFRKLAFRFTLILLAELLLAKFIPSLSAVAVFAYLFWIPQIISNARDDVRNALQPSFIIGWSFLHLVLPMYMLYCPVNLFVAAQPAIAWLMFSLVVVQVAILLLQEKLGPRFFVPARFLPKKYDYHRPIPLRRVTSSAPASSSSSSRTSRAATESSADIEMPLVSSAFTDSSSDLPPLSANASESTDGIAAAVGASAGGSSAATPAAAAAGAAAGARHDDDSKRNHMTDVPLDSSNDGTSTNENEEEVCPICYCEFEANGSRFLTMVTPCDHVFHTTCLSRWMDQKMECPTCRGALPPL